MKFWKMGLDRRCSNHVVERIQRRSDRLQPKDTMLLCRRRVIVISICISRVTRPDELPSADILPLDQVYSFEPVPDVLNSDQSKHIIGAQGNVWSEYITDEASLAGNGFPADRCIGRSTLVAERKTRLCQFHFTAGFSFQAFEFYGCEIFYCTLRYFFKSFTEWQQRNIRRVVFKLSAR